MERSEPVLVPQWLKNPGSLTGGGSLSHSDDRATSRIARNKSFVNSNGRSSVKSNGRSSSSERTTSSYFRRNSSSNGCGHSESYANFGRNKRDKEWEKDTYDYHDKDKLVFGNGRSRDSSHLLQNTFSSKLEMDGLRRSQSIRNYNNDTLNKGSPVSSVRKETILTDFPSLGAEERTCVPDVRRISSPGLSSSFQSLPPGTSAAIGGEKWTSALAEVPMFVGSNGTAITSVQQATAASSSSLTLGTTTSLNMVEAVAQGPSRAQTAPQLSVETQRLEELAIKQSRQLIPVTPSMPKSLVNASSDKQRTKAGMLQHSVSSPLPVTHSPRGAPLKSDASKASTVGKLQILKPVREKNGVTPLLKDNTLSPTNGSKVVSSATVTAPNNPVSDRKPVLTVLEKRPTSQAKSRNDFFNLVRKKSMPNSSSATENSSSVVEDKESPTFSDKIVEMDVVLAPDTPRAACEDQLSKNPNGPHSHEDRGDQKKCGCNGKKHPSFDPIFSEEEEASFLRSLGWEENADEDGLTEEEITAFYRDVTKYINSKPSLKILVQGVQQPNFQLPFDSQTGGTGLSSSSSNAKLES